MFLFTRHAFGIDISDYSVELLELEELGFEPRVRSYARAILEKGVVENSKIIDKGVLGSEIARLLEETKPYLPKTKRVIASLPESKTFIHIFKLPSGLKGKELAHAIESEARKTIPLEENEFYFDFKLGHKLKDMQEVFYAAAKKDIVNSFEKLFFDIGLELIILDLESASIARAVRRAPEKKDEPVLIIDIGARTADLTIYDRDLIRLSTTVFVGGQHFTDILAEKLKILPEKAEVLKRQVGLSHWREEGRVMFILQNALQEIIKEIQKSCRFYKRKAKREVKKVFLVGGSSLLPELPSYLSSNLGMEVRLADPWQGIDTAELEAQKEMSALFETKLHPVFFTNVIGLALRGIDSNPEKTGINLLPKKEKSWLDFLKT